jgi:hypothetical protein
MAKENVIKKIKEAFTAEVVLSLILFEGWISSFATYFYINELKNAAIFIFSGGLLVFIVCILIPIFGKTDMNNKKGLSNEKIIGTPGRGREYDFTNFPKSKEEVEEIEEKSISESNPFSDKIKCLAKHYFTKLPLFSELMYPLMLKKVKDLPIYENKEELQKALEEIKNVFGDDFEIIQDATLINLMSFFDELNKFHTMYGLSPEEYYQEILKKIKW